MEVVRESGHELNPSDDQNCEQHVGDESLKGGEEVGGSGHCCAILKRSRNIFGRGG